MSSLSSKIIPISLGLVAAVLLGAWGVVSAKAAKTSGSVVLSNGKTVYLGESKSELIKSMATSLIDDGGNYKYSGGSGRQEGLIFMSNDKVSAMRLTYNAHNRHLATKIGIGTKLPAIADAKVRNLSRVVNPGLYGYKYKSNQVAAYFLADRCSSAQSVLTLAVAVAGKEGSVLPAPSRVEACSAFDGGE